MTLVEASFSAGDAGPFALSCWPPASSLAVVGKSKSEDLIGDLEPERGMNRVEVDGVMVALEVGFGPSSCLAPERGVLCIFLSDPNLLTDVDPAKLEIRSEGEAVDPPVLKLEEEEEDERSAPLSLFFALMSASGVLMG